MSEENQFKLTPSKKIDNDKLVMDENDFVKKDSPKISKTEIDDNIEKLKSDDLKIQTESILFFEQILRYHDIILPPEYLEATLNFFQSHSDNKELVNLLLAFYRHCTGFESDMQDFLFEKEIINVIAPFFPNEKVLSILGNLSIKSIKMTGHLLSLDILEQITPLINAFYEAESSELIDKESEILKNFINSVDLLDCLLYNFDESLSEFIPKIIELFDIIYSSYEKVPEEQARNVVQAFSDYVKDSVFIQSFLDKQQLKAFLEKDINENEVICLIIQIIKSIINEYECKGVDYLIEFNIINWIEKQIFSDSQKVVYMCFATLTKMIDEYDPRNILTTKNPESKSSIQTDEKSNRPLNLANECIQNELLIKAIDKCYDEKNIYRLKFTLYEFVCTVFMNATYDQIPLLINEKALDLIVNNYEIIEDDEDEWFLIWQSLQRLIPFKFLYTDALGGIPCDDIAAVQEKIKKIKGDAIFIDWLLNIRDYEDFFDYYEHDEVLKLFIDCKEYEEKDQ